MMSLSRGSFPPPRRGPPGGARGGGRGGAQGAAADVDDVLLEDDLRQRAAALGEAEEREVLGQAPAIGEARVEGVDLSGGVAGGGGQEQHAWLRRRGE